MPVDSSIYGAFSQPAKSTVDYAAQYDAQDARRMLMQQNALALQSGRQKADEYTRSVNEAGTLRNALMGLGAGATDEQRIQTMRGTGLPGGYSQADALQKTLIERDKGQAESRAKQAETMSKVLTAQGELATRVIANPTRESAMAAVANMKAITQALGVPLDLSQDEQQIAQMTDPAQITRWAQGHSLKATDFLAKLQSVNNGKTTSFVDMNPVSNPGGPAPISMTTTPGEDLTSATSIRTNAATNATSRANNRDTLAQGAAQFDTTQNAAKWDHVNQVWVNPKAQTITPGVSADGAALPGKPLTEAQAKATKFLARMADASSAVAELESNGTSSANLRTKAAGSDWTNWLASPEGQQYKQAASNWLSANLRDESGAAIGILEENKDYRKFFPQINDDPATIAQKARSRRVAEEAMRAEAGPGAKQLPKILADSGGAAGAGNGTGKPSGSPSKITDDAGYNALPSGATFVGPDGKTRRKP